MKLSGADRPLFPDIIACAGDEARAAAEAIEAKARVPDSSSEEEEEEEEEEEAGSSAGALPGASATTAAAAAPTAAATVRWTPPWCAAGAALGAEVLALSEWAQPCGDECWCAVQLLRKLRACCVEASGCALAAVGDRGSTHGIRSSNSARWVFESGCRRVSGQRGTMERVLESHGQESVELSKVRIGCWKRAVVPSRCCVSGARWRRTDRARWAPRSGTRTSTCASWSPSSV